jgi:hypothetical protein
LQRLNFKKFKKKNSKPQKLGENGMLEIDFGD